MKFKRVVEFSNDPGDFSSFNARVMIPKTVAEAVTLVKQFHKLAVINGKYSLDDETSGLYWTVDELFMVSLYTKGMSLIIPCAWSSPGISVADLKLILRPLVSDKSICCILHNAKFDMHFLLNHGVVIENEVHDTIVAGFVLDVEKPDGLKERARVELKLEMKEFKDLFPLGGKQKLRLNDYPAVAVAAYAALDTFGTYGLSEVFFTSTPQIKCKHRLGLKTDDPDLIYIYDRVDAPMVRMFFDMERRGVAVDVAAVEKIRVEYENKLKHLEEQILLEAGVAFNMRSWQQVKKVFAGRGIPLKSTDAKNLSKVVRERKDKLAELMLLHRSDSKILSNYISSIFRFKTAAGRVHTSLNLHIAGTGRVSSSNPINIQNQPKAAWWRKIYIARPGYKIIVRDLSQIELRILAEVSKDPVLLDEYMHGVDVHMNNGKLIAQALGRFWDKLTDKEKAKYRQDAKSSLSFGVIYGMSAPSLANEIGISEDDAEALICAIFNKYRIVDQWIKRVHHFALTNGWVKTMFGRKRNIPQVLSSERGKKNYGLRQSVNSIVQGGAGDFMKMALIEIAANKRLKELGYVMLFPVHDEIVGEVPEANAEEANLIVKKCMAEFPVAKQLSIPFPSEGGVGANWAEAKEQKT